ADHISIDPLSFDLMRIANHGALDYAGVHVDGVFHFCRTDPVTAYIQYIVNAAGDPVKAVFIAQSPVPGEIHIWIGRKVGLPAALVVAVSGTDDGRPGGADAEVARGGIAGHLLAVFV